jgi:hypothetical protein
MKKIIAVTLCLSVFLLGFKGDEKEFNYDKKTGIASVAGTEVFKIEEMKSATLPGMKDLSIKNISGKELMYLKIDGYKDPQKVEAANPEGKEFYIQINFMNDGTTTEINFYMRNKKIAEIINDAKLIVNGELDVEAQKRFIMINGNRFTKRRDEINNANKVIIIDNSNNQPPPPQNGLNIHIGN